MTWTSGSISCWPVSGWMGGETRAPADLSRGMRQKLQLACALIRPFRVLLLDEPVVGLDPASQRTLRELLLEAKRDRAAVMLTTHQLEFARGIADRALLLADGAVVQDGPYEDVVDGERARAGCCVSTGTALLLAKRRAVSRPVTLGRGRENDRDSPDQARGAATENVAKALV